MRMVRIREHSDEPVFVHECLFRFGDILGHVEDGHPGSIVFVRERAVRKEPNVNLGGGLSMRTLDGYNDEDLPWDVSC